MKSPRLKNVQLLLCQFFLISLFSSCSFHHNEELPKQINEILEEEENPGSEVFEDDGYEVYGDGQDENGMTFAIKDNILHKISFEGSNPLSSVWKQFCCNHSNQVALNPLNSKEKVGRFELRNTDKVKTSTTTSARAEILFPLQKHKERWYAVSVFFPTSGYAKDRVTEIIMQWHQSSGYSPANAVEVAG
jgi:hypothetical protein